MKRTTCLALATIAGMTVASSLITTRVSAQVAGTTLLGVEYAELRDVVAGWSAKRQLLGHAVYNEKNEKVGSVDDLIVSSSKAVSYAIIGAGGFLGVAKHDVAIPISKFKQDQGKFVLAGASQDAVKVMSEFEYDQLEDVAAGWSAKKQVLGQAVYNEKNEKVGSVDDLIVSSSKTISYAIIGAGGFLGVAKHDVAIPVSQFKQDQGKFVLAEASQDTIKAMPEFEYAPQ
jgi:sporulation protein YlmC with PRC-barrel domain